MSEYGVNGSILVFQTTGVGSNPTIRSKNGIMIKRNKSKAATTLCVCGRKNAVYNTQSKSNMCTISKINGRHMSWTKTYSFI